MRPTAEPLFPAHDAPVRDETTIVDLVVEGTLPTALCGQYVRIGPNPIACRAAGARDADGMVHGVTLHAGRATAYRNRWVQTVATSRRLGGEPVPGPPPTAHDAATTNVITFGGRLYALEDGALAYELDARLETVRRVDLAGAGRGVGAHPKVDPVTGELHLLSAPGEPSCQHHIVSATAQTRRTRPIPASPVPVTDLAITQDHIVVVGEGAIGLSDRGGGDRFTWRPLDFNAADRVVNAADDGDAVVVEVVGRSVRRITLGPADRGVRERVLQPGPHAFGRTDDRLVGLPHRYLYTVGGCGAPDDGVRLCKHDLGAAAPSTHGFGPDRRPGEFVFVADPARASHEDGGWLIGLVGHDGCERTDLVVLDAADVPAAPLATVHIPRRIPSGGHGTWVPWIV
jgi:carotenoid cleavage dioxygenase